MADAVIHTDGGYACEVGGDHCEQCEKQRAGRAGRAEAFSP